jgi:hypothetical protein
MENSLLTEKEQKELAELEEVIKLQAQAKAQAEAQAKAQAEAQAKAEAESQAKSQAQVTPKSSRFKNQPIDDTSRLESTVENIEDFAKGFAEGAIPFKPQLFAAGEATFSGDNLKSWYERYREAEKINQKRYEELMKDKQGGMNISARAGEAAGMLFDPAVSGISRGVTALGGKLIKPLMRISKEEKLLETAIKGGNAETVATALENLRLKEATPTLIKTLAKEVPTGGVMAGLYGASRSKGTSETLDRIFGYDRPVGEKGLTDDVIENAKFGMLTGGALGFLGHTFSKVFGKEAGTADALRAVAGKELESGERLGVPIQLEESALRGKTFGEPEGQQLIFKETEDVAKELTERAIGSLQSAKDKLNNLISEVEGNAINDAASSANPVFEKLKLKLFNDRYQRFFKRYKREPSPVEHDKMWDKAGFDVTDGLLKEYYPELHQILSYAIQSPKIAKFVNTLERGFLGDLRHGRPINYSTLFSFQSRMKQRYSELADKLQLNSFERNMILGKGDYAGSGIMYNQASEFGVKTPGLMEQALERITPDVEEYRKLIKDYAAGPVETILNENAEIASQPLKAWNYTDEKIKNILQKKFESLIELAGGTNIAASQAANQLNDIYRVMLKAESQGKSGKELQKLADDILDLKQRVNDSSQNTAALVGVVGKNQAQGHMRVEDMAQAFEDPKGLLKGLSTLNLGRAAGKTQATIKALTPGIKLRDMTIDQLKEAARSLSKNDNVIVSNIGKSAMQGLEENPMYKGVFLNQIAQNPELRKNILGILPSTGAISSALMKFAGKSNLTPQEEKDLKELEELKRQSDGK